MQYKIGIRLYSEKAEPMKIYEAYIQMQLCEANFTELKRMAETLVDLSLLEIPTFMINKGSK